MWKNQNVLDFFFIYYIFTKNDQFRLVVDQILNFDIQNVLMNDFNGHLIQISNKLS